MLTQPALRDFLLGSSRDRYEKTTHTAQSVTNAAGWSKPEADASTSGEARNAGRERTAGDVVFTGL